MAQRGRGASTRKPRSANSFGRLIDQGKGYARAEVGLVKAVATAKVDAAKLPAALLAAALLFVIAGVVTFCMTIAWRWRP